MRQILRTYLFLAILMAAFSLISCSRTVIRQTPAELQDGKYDIAFPYGNGSEILKPILEAVRLINSHSYYEVFYFSETDQITKPMINKDLLQTRAREKSIIQDYAVGTATIIYYKRDRIACLTCAHIVDFPDTLIKYFDKINSEGDSMIYSISLKKRQSNVLSDLRQGDDLEILIMDRELDIALLGKKFLFRPTETIPVYRSALGAAKELDWGNFVYVIGFPAGKKMVTSGLISSPNRGKEHSFLVDALFNRGFSGGIVLAIRDGLPNLELVGLVNSVAADNEIVLAPENIIDKDEVDSNTPYTGNVYLRTRRKINYGISFAISIEAILRFINENEDILEDKGYEMEFFFQ